MKRTLLFLIFIATCQFAFVQCTSCKNNKSQDGSRAATSSPNWTILQPVIDGIINIPEMVRDLPVDTVQVQIAINNIDTFSKRITKDNSRQSFLFDAVKLDSYLVNKHSSIIHFFLGEDHSKNLDMYVASNDTSGNHYYYSDTAHGICYVLSACDTCTMPTSLADTNKPFQLLTYYVEAMSAKEGNIAINAYAAYFNNPQVAKKMQYSWLYNAYDLQGYINSGLNKGMKYVQVSLGIVDTSVDLIITGVDVNRKHMYFSYAGVPCVMENCHPCPTCLSYLGGINLEPPTNCNH